MIEKRDIILQARSGTGKTMLLIISILQLIDRTSPTCQALLLVRNRVMVQILQKVFKDLGAYLDIVVGALIGGVNIREQITKLQEERPQVVISTPGRAEDMIRRGFLKMDHLKVLALDEADEIFESGFEDQIKSLVNNVPSDVQIMLVASTLPQILMEFAELIMREPIKLLFGQIAWLVGKLQQWYIQVYKEEWKLDNLIRLYEHLSIIFY